MAEGVLFNIAEEIIKTLGSLASQEVALWWGLKDQLWKLNGTVTRIKAVIQDAEEPAQKQKQNHQIEDWLEKLREAVYDAEDLLDDFSIQVLRKQLMPGKRVSREVRLFFSRSNQFVYGLRMDHRVKALRERLDGIEIDSKKFNVDVRGEERASWTTDREQTTSSEPEITVGRESDKEAVKIFLMNSNYERNVSVISVVGMGGLGKTTLAQHVFNDEQVKANFGVRLWVSVSGNLDVRKIIKGAVGTRDFDDQLKSLKKEFEEKIGKKKYLLVFDDVWDGEDGKEKWYGLKELLPRDAVGSKIVVTTRSHVIAKFTSTIEPHVLEGLSEDESWDLFRRKAFPQGQESGHVDERIRKEIVERCCGVPLVIKAIARLISLKDRAQWLPFIQQELPNRVTDNNIIDTLKLSYDPLPSYLKHCFAYCSLFPKGHKIDVKYLIRLWIAQGFVISSSNSGRRCIEIVGLKCFESLLWRSFFHEVKKDGLGNIESCKMHDCMHDLATHVAGFQSIKVERGGNRISELTRHVSFDTELDLSLPFAKRPRTLILSKGGKWDEGSWKSICRDSRLLRVLVLSQLGMKEVPPLIEKLKHLKYLDLSNNEMEALSNSVSNLKNLQVLKLNGCRKLKELPKDIGKLINLRYLDVGCYLDDDLCENLEYMPRGIGKLTSLHRLSCFVAAKNRSSKSVMIGGLDELSELNELRGRLEIRVKGYEGGYWTSEFEGAKLKEKQYLQSLTIWWDIGADNISDIDLYDKMLRSLQPNSSLQELKVRGYRAIGFPQWLSLLSKLVKIHLIFCPRLKHIPFLDKIPSLRELLIMHLNNLEYMDSEGGGGRGVSGFFPSLKKLNIYNCPNLKGWWKKSRDEKSDDNDESLKEMLCFPCLSSLCIVDCPNLTSIPFFQTLSILILLRASSIPLQQTMEMTSPVSSSSSSSSCPLSKLKNLYIYFIDDMESLPEAGLRNLSSLQQLSIRGCSRLKSLPLPDQGMPFLQKLNISGCREFECPSQSESQGISYCNGELRVIEYGGMRFPSWLSHLSNLVRVHLRNCRRLKHIPPLDGIPSLEELSITNMDSLECIDSEGVGGKGVSMFFPSLKKLVILACPRVKGWWKRWSRDEMNDDSEESTIEEGLRMLCFPRLSSLRIEFCPNLTSMPLFPTLDEGLDLWRTSSMPLQQTMEMTSPVSSSSSFTRPLSKLKSLYVWSIDDMESLPEVGLQNLSSLQQLRIFRCSRLKSLPLPDQGMHSLQKLEVVGCSELKSLSESESQGMIPYLPSLQLLRIDDCSEEVSGRARGWGKEREEEWPPNIKHIPADIGIDGYYIQKGGRYVKGEGLRFRY